MGIAGKVLFTIEKVICLNETKKAKGKLTLYDDGFIFSGKTSRSGIFDICEVTVSKTKLQVPGLFGEKSKPALRIEIAGKNDEVFAMSERAIIDAIRIINEEAINEAVLRKETVYSSACQRMNSIASSSDALEVYNEFSKILSYKNAQIKAEECRAIEEDLRQKEGKYDFATLFTGG